MTQPPNYTDSDIEDQVIAPLGGITVFRLKCCPEFKLIQYYGEDGTLFDLVLEDDLLADSTIRYLEKVGVPEIDWKG